MQTRILKKMYVHVKRILLDKIYKNKAKKTLKEMASLLCIVGTQMLWYCKPGLGEKALVMRYIYLYIYIYIYLGEENTLVNPLI